MRINIKILKSHTSHQIFQLSRPQTLYNHTNQLHNMNALFESRKASSIRQCAASKTSKYYFSGCPSRIDLVSKSL